MNKLEHPQDVAYRIMKLQNLGGEAQTAPHAIITAR